MNATSGKPGGRPEGFRVSDEGYRLLFENANDAIFIVDVETGLILDVNHQACVLLGRPRQEVVGLHVSQVHPPDKRTQYERKYREFIESGRTVTEDAEVLRADGVVVPISISASVIEYGGRRIIQGSFRTDRQKAEADLLDSEDKLKAIVHGSPIPQFIISREHKVVQWNRPLEEMSGIQERDVIGTDLHWKAFYSEARPCLCDLLVDGKEEGIPVWYRGKSSKSKSAPEAYEATDFLPLLGRWLHFMGATIRNSKGDIIGAVETLQDITDRKRYEEALVEAKKHLQAIYDTSPDLIFIHDQDGRIMDVNEMVLKNMGYTREELKAADVFDISGKGLIHNMGVEKIGLAAKGIAQDFEWVCRKKDGAEFPVEIRLRGFESTSKDGKPVPLVLSIVRDISERKRAEEERARLEGQLLRAQKMESIGRLAGGIAHDFNNLLTPILGFSDLLLNDFTPADPRHESIRHIREAADRAKDLTRQLLSFGRRQTLALKPVDLGDVVKRFEAMLQRTIREDIRMDLAIAPDLNMVQADMGQIEQILMNLAVNAQDAMPAGGVLTIGLENVNLDETSAVQHPHLGSGIYVMLTVSDSGVGMTAETQRHLFDPFFTTKEVGRGTGLGLSTVYGIVKQHGGSISVYSESGKGSVFRIYFPRIVETVAASGEAPAARVKSVVGGKETILVVEDNAMVRDLTCVMLRRLGYQVIAAEGGDSAFNVAASCPGTIDLLVTDMVLPKMAGQEVFRQLRAGRAGLKVLYMSGFSSSNVTHDGILEEGTNFIQKPLTYDSLSKVVRHVLDSPP